MITDVVLASHTCARMFATGPSKQKGTTVVTRTFLFSLRVQSFSRCCCCCCCTPSNSRVGGGGVGGGIRCFLLHHECKPGGLSLHPRCTCSIIFALLFCSKVPSNVMRRTKKVSTQSAQTA